MVWRGCWACGRIVFDDEPGICTDCTLLLDTPPVAPAGARPLAWYLRGLTPETLRSMCEAITDTGIAQAEEGAAAWATEHLDGRQRSVYVGDVRGRAPLEYSTRCARDAQEFGHTMGWGNR